MHLSSRIVCIGIVGLFAIKVEVPRVGVKKPKTDKVHARIVNILES